MSFARTLSSVCTITTFAALVGCAAVDDRALDDDAIDDAELNLVAIADRPSGNQLRFYEPMPGQILTVELGEAATMPTMADAIALYQAAVPGGEAPAALVDAQSRADGLRLLDNPADEGTPIAETSLAPGREVDPAPTGPVAAALAACSLNTFIANECNDGDQEWCKLNWSGGHWASNTSVNTMHNAVCPLTGNVKLKLIVDSSLKGSFPVNKGGIGRVAWTQNPYVVPYPPFYISNRFGFYTEVANASGVKFHVGGAASDK